MSRVDSQYERRPRDLYETPTWVTEALIPHLPEGRRIWEPAAGGRSIVRALEDSGRYDVHATDLIDGQDFFSFRRNVGAEGIVSNPPYSDADRFIQHAISLMTTSRGFVAMLLPSDFDSAKSRRYLFADNRLFAKTVVLTKRIVWFERADGKKAAPSENHRWFIWSWKHEGPPITRYAP